MYDSIFISANDTYHSRGIPFYIPKQIIIILASKFYYLVSLIILASKFYYLVSLIIIDCLLIFFVMLDLFLTLECII